MSQASILLTNRLLPRTQSAAVERMLQGNVTANALPSKTSRLRACQHAHVASARRVLALVLTYRLLAKFTKFRQRKKTPPFKGQYVSVG